MKDSMNQVMMMLWASLVVLFFSALWVQSLLFARLADCALMAVMFRED
jgi:hypothetical protein